MPTPTFKLISGYEMPMVGLGTWQSQPGEVGKAVEVALNAGYNLIDCAWIYGNQAEIGETLKKLFSTTHKRENIFITSKVWNTFHLASACKEHVKEILNQLQLDYIDLMLIHWPHGYEEGGEPFPKREDCEKMKYSDVDYLTTWKVLEDFVKEGKIRSIGVSNFNHKQIERIIASGTVKPAVLQVELHPYFQQKKLREFCKEHGIAVTAYSSLSNPGSAFFRKDGDPNLLTEPVIKKIASAHNKTPAQIALRWAVQLNVLVIPKSTSEARIKENAALFDFKLTDEEMKEIDGLDRGWRIVNLTARDGDHPHFPFLEEF
uniref:Aldo keto reductase domain containing protein n=1 Tax=Haemonchus contortus TaxID=6289 RepID=W6NG80_HAECO